MANTYTWTVTGMSTLPSPPAPVDGYVVWANYTVTGSNDATPPIIVSIPSNAQFTVSSSGDIIPYEDLTQEIVLGWIQNQAGTQSLMQKIVDQQIYALEHPPIEPVPTPLPWPEPEPTPPS